MSTVLRIFLVVSSIVAFIFCIRKIKQSKLKVTNSAIWLLGSLCLILMSIFSDFVGIVSKWLGFVSPVNFVFLVIIGFLLVQNFIDNIRISILNDKVKDLNHHLAIKEYNQKINEEK